jgi:hypothetical protein
MSASGIGSEPTRGVGIVYSSARQRSSYCTKKDINRRFLRESELANSGVDVRSARREIAQDPARFGTWRVLEGILEYRNRSRDPNFKYRLLYL